MEPGLLCEAAVPLLLGFYALCVCRLQRLADCYGRHALYCWMYVPASLTSAALTSAPLTSAPAVDPGEKCYNSTAIFASGDTVRLHRAAFPQEQQLLTV